MIHKIKVTLINSVVLRKIEQKIFIVNQIQVLQATYSVVPKKRLFVRFQFHMKNKKMILQEGGVS